MRRRTQEYARSTLCVAPGPRPTIPRQKLRISQALAIHDDLATDVSDRVEVSGHPVPSARARRRGRAISGKPAAHKEIPFMRRRRLRPAVLAAHDDRVREYAHDPGQGMPDIKPGTTLRNLQVPLP